MNFSFSDEQRSLREVVRRYATKRLTTTYLERAKSDEFPRDIWQDLGQLGLFGLTVPESSGGEGADCLTAGIVAEELAYADFNVASFILFGTMAVDLLLKLGSESDEALKWGDGTRQGEMVVAGAFTEPQAGSDLAGIKACATRTADGWQITGEKASISLVSAADAALVLARIGEGTHDQSLFLVPLDLPGVSRQRFHDPGFRPVGRGMLTFDHVVIPPELQVAEAGRGFRAVMEEFDLTRVLLGLMCVGAAQASIDEAGEYAKVREAFGRPIAKFQGVAFPLAEHETWLESVRLLCYSALWKRDAGLPNTKEAAMVKWLAPERAVAAAHDAVLLHGNVGYTAEAPYVQRMLDIMAIEIGDGTAQIQKSIIAREKLGRHYRPY